MIFVHKKEKSIVNRVTPAVVARLVYPAWRASLTTVEVGYLEPVWSRNIAGDHESDQTNSRLHNWQKRLPGPTTELDDACPREKTRIAREDRTENKVVPRPRAEICPGQDTINEFQLVPTDLHRALSTSWIIYSIGGKTYDYVLKFGHDTKLIKLRGTFYNGLV